MTAATLSFVGTDPDVRGGVNDFDDEWNDGLEAGLDQGLGMMGWGLNCRWSY